MTVSTCLYLQLALFPGCSWAASLWLILYMYVTPTLPTTAEVNVTNRKTRALTTSTTRTGSAHVWNQLRQHSQTLVHLYASHNQLKALVRDTIWCTEQHMCLIRNVVLAETFLA